jgi:hypothetical protein
MLLSLSSVVNGEQEMNLKLSNPGSAKKDHKSWGTDLRKIPRQHTDTHEVELSCA